VVIKTDERVVARTNGDNAKVAGGGNAARP
jgi:hypothetical protein